MKLKLLVFVFSISLFFENVYSKNLRNNPELITFNTGVNSEVTRKIQDEAVIISLEKVRPIPEDYERSHILFGFDVFNFVPQSLTISVDYSRRELSLHLSSTSTKYSLSLGLKSNDSIESFLMKLNDEDDTLFVQINCESTGSVVTPINLVKFFRSVGKHKFKVLFNKYYALKVYTEDDNMDVKIMDKCQRQRLKNIQQTELEVLTAKLVSFTQHFNNFLSNTGHKSAITSELFIRTFLTKDVYHQSSNIYRIIRLLRSTTGKFSAIFNPELEILLHKIFWTQGKEHRYVRSDRMLYSNDMRIKLNILNALFSYSPPTYTDYLRSMSEIGEGFRDIFLNPQISINEVMQNETSLVESLLDIMFNQTLPEDELKFLNSPSIVKKLFGYHFMKDVNVNTTKLNDILKRFIFNADKNDYVVIGRFIRSIFFQPSSMKGISNFIESDLIIGMRVVYLLTSGQSKGKQEIYWTVRNLITKKDIELPMSLEYPPEQIMNTLTKCYVDIESTRFEFMLTMENLVTENAHDIGRVFDKGHGQYIYQFYRDLILNDLSKEKSILKKAFSEYSDLIHEFIFITIQSVVANVDQDETFAEIAINYVKDALAYAGLQSNILKTDKNYIDIFKKIVGTADELTDNQKKMNFKIFILRAKYTGIESGRDAVNLAMQASHLKTSPEKRIRLEHVYEKKLPMKTLVTKMDQILEKNHHTESEFENIVSSDLRGGVTFDDNHSNLDSPSLFTITEEEEGTVMEIERMMKLRELKILEEWYSEEVKQYIPSKTQKIESGRGYMNIQLGIEDLQSLENDGFGLTPAKLIHNTSSESVEYSPSAKDGPNNFKKVTTHVTNSSNSVEFLPSAKVHRTEVNEIHEYPSNQQTIKHTVTKIHGGPNNLKKVTTHVTNSSNSVEFLPSENIQRTVVNETHEYPSKQQTIKHLLTKIHDGRNNFKKVTTHVTNSSKSVEFLPSTNVHRTVVNEIHEYPSKQQTIKHLLTKIHDGPKKFKKVTTQVTNSSNSVEFSPSTNVHRTVVNQIQATKQQTIKHLRIKIQDGPKKFKKVTTQVTNSPISVEFLPSANVQRTVVNEIHEYPSKQETIKHVRTKVPDGPNNFGKITTQVTNSSKSVEYLPLPNVHRTIVSEIQEYPSKQQTEISSNKKLLKSIRNEYEQFSNMNQCVDLEKALKDVLSHYAGDLAGCESLDNLINQLSVSIKSPEGTSAKKIRYF